MPTAYSRVTVVNGARRVDLALPSALPLSEVMPQLLGYCAPDGAPEQPAGWTLVRLGGGTLSLSTTLADAGITDGDVLELRTAYDNVHPAYVEDVRDVLEDTMDEAARQWQPSTTVGFALVTGAAGLAFATLLPSVWQPRSVAPLVTAVVVAALLVLAGWWATRQDHGWVAQLTIAVAALWAGVAGWLAASFPQWPVAAALGAALAAALLLTALARVATHLATAQLAALSLVGAAGIGVGATELAGSDPIAAARVAAVLAVIMVGVLPRVSLTVGGLASADYRVRNHGLITGAELTHRIEQSNALLYGGLLGAAVVGAGSGVLLATTGSRWDAAFGAAVGLALALRSRVFSRVPQIVPLRVVGLAVLVVHGIFAAQTVPELVPWLVLIGAAVATGAVALSAVPLSDVARARVKQLLNRVELIVMVGVLALAAAALGWFDWVEEFTPS
ncbi:type VII secretion integral membrane protein EccD [Natronosporangium hydrolyticum]|uniref:Type VII secretion integral membrane protein EccD n=1 Tax=Natronosporangium hydrolyticum TaxID=2811111 RepID=A0A895YNM2_9ACTN|nr:type VII secretion integral membrane protein EccD [Natronosporangium hydrolyticum]QSB15720.1 type VII secretion integral membrane protein EccD [Natronosporangium hydrolyticum]